MTLPLDAGRLDDVAAITAGDPGEMLRAIATSAAQVRSGATAAAEAGVASLAATGRPRAVVIVGMGTAALAGDVLAALARSTCPVPVVVSRGFTVPGWVGAADVVVALSSSGSTEETLVATEEATRRGAHIVGIGPAGSPLADRIERARGLLVPVSEVHSARATFWALATPLLAVGGALGLVDLPGEVFEATAERLYGLALRCQPSTELFLNPAKELALSVAGTVPTVWGTSGLTTVASDRFTSQWAQNGKAPALAGSLPDAAQGVISTWDGPWIGGAEDLFADPLEGSAPTRLHPILLRDSSEHPRIAAQAEAVRSLAQARGAKLTELRADGEYPYERLASLIGLIDYASGYLAVLTGVDPSPTPANEAVRLAAGAAAVAR